MHLLPCAGLAAVLLALAPTAPDPDARAELFAETFDAHWEALDEGYPYFELYGVDWDAEREDHRPKAVAAADETEFAWELVRLFSCLPDPHLAFLPALDEVAASWSMPEVETVSIRDRHFVEAWPEGQAPLEPAEFADDPLAYPEIVEVRGMPANGTAIVLVPGPVGTTFDLLLRWPDGSETVHQLRRPDEPNFEIEPSHYGEDWLTVGRVGEGGRIGYMGIRTFDPDRATLGPDGKMTTMLRAALEELEDTDALVLDFQGNGGGLVAASDPFLGNLIKKRISYRWGNVGGKRRVIRTRRPRYEGQLVAIVDERSASGGEWAARILRDAERALVVGGPTTGAEAAVPTSDGPDGSVVHYSAWPMIEPGRTPFQHTGIELDHPVPLTIGSVRELGFDAAFAQVRRPRFLKALELLGGGQEDLDELVELAGSGRRSSAEDG